MVTSACAYDRDGPCVHPLSLSLDRGSLTLVVAVGLEMQGHRRDTATALLRVVVEVPAVLAEAFRCRVVPVVSAGGAGHGVNLYTTLGHHDNPSEAE